MKQKTVIKSQYDLHLEIEIHSGSSGEVIDTMFEDEHYDTYGEALAAADEYREELGNEFCSWGDDIGILKDVSVDDEPTDHEYLVFPWEVLS